MHIRENEWFCQREAQDDAAAVEVFLRCNNVPRREQRADNSDGSDEDKQDDLVLYGDELDSDTEDILPEVLQVLRGDRDRRDDRGDTVSSPDVSSTSS